MINGLYELMKVPIGSVKPTCLVLKTDEDAVLLQEGIIYPLVKRKLKISFDTYFGAFHIEPWKTIANVKNLYFSFAFRGKGLLNLIYANPFGEKEIIFQKKIESQNLKTDIVHLDLDIIPNIGIIYPEFTFLEGYWFLKDVTYLTTQKPIQEVQLALIMTTYKRENFVYRNIENLKPILSKKINLIIVDNSQTLKLEKKIPHIKVYYNPNYGGSGGFTRGILEAIESEKYSHIVLMDDDIIIYPETVLRTLRFFEYTEQDVVIGGAMLNLSKKEIINECGALYKNLTFILLKHNLNICDFKKLLRCSYLENVKYFGWWFFGLPLTLLKKTQLPMPFFIRGDDIEFSYRLKKVNPEVKFVNLLGVGVWHEEFYKKDNPLIDYYITRNGLIFSILYEYDDFNKSIKKLFLSIIKNLLLYRYERVKYILLGIEDFLKGPTFLKEIDAEEYHKKLQSIQKIKPENYKSIFLSYKYNRKIKFAKLKKILAILTFNGHIIPPFFIQKGEKPDDTGFIFENLHSNRIEALFLKETVVFYEPTKGIGLKYKLSRKNFFKYLFKSMLLISKLIIRKKFLFKIYQEELNYLTSISFWKKYLKLNK